MEEKVDGVGFLGTLSNPTGGKPVNKGSYLSVSTDDLHNPYFSYPVVSPDRPGKFYRGECLLINQRDFDPSTNHSRRNGTDIDADRIERVFRSLNYKVTRILNITKKALGQTLVEASQKDHSSYDSFVFVMLTHGENNIVYTSDDEVQTSYIMSFFRGDRCPSLIGKPKLFFFQACRGVSFDKGVSTMVADAGDDVIVHKLPVEADILVSYSTVPGYFAWRNSTTGSWYIQELCNALETDIKNGNHTDIMTLLTVVARVVAYQYRSSTGQVEADNMKQMTSTVSTLTRLFHITGPPKEIK
ncbi:Caspase-3 [Schistosoma japonicum]|uniref:Caspase 3, apoptosis-related cysteine peptidase n=1 Tax=Schistosoma japonicum TaxID=6182 RepID=C1LPF1_SCHJA|nr:Caspase-3 [Schistosoma japonicum]CAX76579.1 caspase 3, apoptosis-related cysteine peptidase [Schistosoma japonicum]CAX76581.1 caspase 3, apoptosis-related cysteine peptidase [Schistosoma japonicum]